MLRNEEEIVQFYEQTFREMHILHTIIKLVKESCEEKENKGIYYGLKVDGRKQICNERNHYINGLEAAEDRLSNILKMYVSAEDNFCLHQNSYNSG